MSGPAWIAFAWCLFVVTGFRAPWNPIPLEADEGGIRQLVFSLCALLALRALAFRRALNAAVGTHIGHVAFAALLLLTIAWSTDVVLTTKRAVLHTFGLIVGFAVVHATPSPERAFVAVLFRVGAVCAWVSLAQKFAVPADCWSLPYRPGLAGIASHPNVLGPCLAVGWIASLAAGAIGDCRGLMLRVAQAGIAWAMLLTDSVTSLITALVGTALWITWTAQSYRAGLIGVATVGAFVVGILIGEDTLRSTFFDVAGRDESLSGRDVLWEKVRAEGDRKPLVGHGFGAFWYEDRGRELVQNWNPKQAHHSWIDLYVDLGLLGAALFVLLIPLRLPTLWQRAAGHRGSPRQAVVATAFAIAVPLLGVAAFSESFFLRNDKLAWFACAWGVMLVERLGRRAAD